MDKSAGRVYVQIGHVGSPGCKGGFHGEEYIVVEFFSLLATQAEANVSFCVDEQNVVITIIVLQ
ncbi:MAG: hypothetical protein ACD_10C00463G0001 [uncultured bacterium]|nr:MAG: hypothetical protein ACD_10C00463G0001 [uncultured bacterium]